MVDKMKGDIINLRHNISRNLSKFGQSDRKNSTIRSNSIINTLTNMKPDSSNSLKETTYSIFSKPS